MRTGLAVLALFLAACGTNKPTAASHPSTQAALQHRLDVLRASFNRGSCGDIWDRAHPLFQRQSRDEWIDACAALHAQYGDWSAAELTGDTKTTGPTLHVTSRSRFTKGSLRLDMSFESAGGELQLSRLAYSRIFPTEPGVPKLHADPPPARAPRG